MGSEMCIRDSITGVGSASIHKSLYGLPCETAGEFDCIGRGGLWLSNLPEALVVSMGTGTALVHATRGKPAEYLGGTGVGGGTLAGLSRMLLGMDNLSHVEALAASGDLRNIDLRVSDISGNESLPGMRGDMTAANFGRISDLASKSDIALGILNMVFETIGMCAYFAARSFGLDTIVLTGNLATAPQAASTFSILSDMFHMRFLIPQRAQFGPVIGAALIAAQKPE